MFHFVRFSIRHHHIPEFIRIQKKIPNSFVVVPQFSAQRKHITIDTTSLMYLANTFLKKGEKILITTKRNDDDRLELWNRFFDLSDVTTSNRLFAYSITTNGVDASVRLTRRSELGKIRTRMKKKAQNEIGNYIPLGY